MVIMEFIDNQTKTEAESYWPANNKYKVPNDPEI